MPPGCAPLTAAPPAALTWSLSASLLKLRSCASLTACTSPDITGDLKPPSCAARIAAIRAARFAWLSDMWEALPCSWSDMCSGVPELLVLLLVLLLLLATRGTEAWWAFSAAAAAAAGAECASWLWNFFSAPWDAPGVGALMPGNMSSCMCLMASTCTQHQDVPVPLAVILMVICGRTSFTQQTGLTQPLHPYEPTHPPSIHPSIQPARRPGSQPPTLLSCRSPLKQRSCCTLMAWTEGGGARNPPSCRLRTCSMPCTLQLTPCVGLISLFYISMSRWLMSLVKPAQLAHAGNNPFNTSERTDIMGKLAGPCHLLCSTTAWWILP